MGRCVAVIPARGGSKGIPRKNLMDFCGKPLVVWTIEQALAARKIDEVWVSSDDSEILDVSENAGAKPLKRPLDLSDDAASSESCWLHAVDAIDELGGEPIDILVAPQCTSPVREARDFDAALEIFARDGLDSLFSATLATDFNLWRRKADSALDSYTYDYRNRGRRQTKPEQYLENGSFWIVSPDFMRGSGNRLGGRIGVYLMDFWKSFQIDEPGDARFCATLMREYGLVEK